MFALMHINSEAFIRGNMNLLREGATLIIPSVEMMAGISRILAREEYTRQLSDWIGYRQGIKEGRSRSGERLWVSLVPSTEIIVVKEIEKTILKEVPVDRVVVKEVENSEVPQDDQSDPADSDGTATGEYVLRIVQPVPDVQPEKVSKETNSVVHPTDQSATDPELQNVRHRLILAEEALASRDLENEKLFRQIALLAEQIDKSAKIIALQDEALALAQQQATLRTQNVVAIESDEGSNQTDTEATVKASDNTVQALVSAESQGSSSSEVKTDQAEVTKQESSFSKSEQLLLILGVAAVGILLIFFLIRRGRHQAYRSEDNLDGRNEGDSMTATTQLDLARAYIEMGDNGAAKNMLNEVVQHGDADQRASAQAMLVTLDNK